MDFLALAGLYGIIFPTIGVCLLLLLLYGIIRVGVARGMRDHQMWMEKNRGPGRLSRATRTTVGQYFGFFEGGSSPPAPATAPGEPSARE